MNHATERSLEGVMAELRALRQAYGAAQKRCTASLMRLHTRNQALEEEVLQLRAQLAARDVAMAWTQQAAFAADTAENLQQRPQMVGRIEALMQRLQTLLRSLRNPAASRVAVFGAGDAAAGTETGAMADGAGATAGGGPGQGGARASVGGAGSFVGADARVAVFAAGQRTAGAVPPAPTQPPVNAFVAPPSSAWPAPGSAVAGTSGAGTTTADLSDPAGTTGTAGTVTAGMATAGTATAGTAVADTGSALNARNGHPGTAGAPDGVSQMERSGDDCTDPPDLEERLVEADLVICQTGCLSHQAYWRVQDHCRRHNKTCVLVEQPDALRIIRIHQRDEATGTGAQAGAGDSAHVPAGAMTQE